MYAVDFHAHLDWYPESGRTAVLEQIGSRSIITLAASVDIESYRAVSGLALQSPYIIPSFGIHPERAALVLESCGGRLEELDVFLEQSPLIGEIGLDYCWADAVPHEAQEKVFFYILQHCHERGKVCVIHTKGAEQRIADILADFPRAVPVIHWYSGPESVYKLYMERGYAATFGCGLYYSQAERNLLALTPRESILSETDNPVGEPWLFARTDGTASVRRERIKPGVCDDSPALIFRVLGDIAAVLGMDTDAAARLTYANARRLLSYAGIIPSV